MKKMKSTADSFIKHGWCILPPEDFVDVPMMVIVATCVYVDLSGVDPLDVFDPSVCLKKCFMLRHY
jgi:hypothetical protein